MSPTTKRAGNFHASTEDKRGKNIRRSYSSQSESELKIEDESLKDSKIKPTGGFQLNLKKLERQVEEDGLDLDILED